MRYFLGDARGEARGEARPCRFRPTSPASVETGPNTGYLGLQNEPILGRIREGCASRPSRARGGEAMARATTRSAGRTAKADARAKGDAKETGGAPWGEKEGTAGE